MPPTPQRPSLRQVWPSCNLNGARKVRWKDSTKTFKQKMDLHVRHKCLVEQMFYQKTKNGCVCIYVYRIRMFVVLWGVVANRGVGTIYSYYIGIIKGRGCNFVQGCIVTSQLLERVKPKSVVKYCDAKWPQYITNKSQIRKYKLYMIQMRGPWHLNFKRSEHTSSLTIMSCLWLVRLLRRSLSWSKESPY